MSVPLTDDSCDDDAWLKPTDMHATRRCFLACRLSFLGLPQFIQHSTFALHEIIYIHLLDLYWSIICCYNYLETIRLSPNTGKQSNLSEIERHDPENAHQHNYPHTLSTHSPWAGSAVPLRNPRLLLLLPHKMVASLHPIAPPAHSAGMAATVSSSAWTATASSTACGKTRRRGMLVRRS